MLRKDRPSVVSVDLYCALIDKAAGKSDESMTETAVIEQEPAFIWVGEGDGRRRIAVRARAGGSPGLIWLGGFNSDMKGTKALALDAWAAEHGRGCVRFDYSGHGESGGAFIDGTIGRWLEESVAVFGQFCSGPTVVVGSSMGVWLRPSEYGEGAPYPITRGLIEEGRKHLLLGSKIDVGCPVRILQGAQDPDVPWQHAFALAHRLPSEDVVLTMIQDGDHRLSRPQDIARIVAGVKEIG